MVKVWLHSTGDASALAALLRPQIRAGILGCRALPPRRLARLGATPDFHHGLLGYPPPAQVAGVLYNAIFLDQLDSDALHMQQINELVARLPEYHRGDPRRIELLVLRPSQDLGLIANAYEPQLPRAFRFLTRGLGTRETRSNDMLSLVMFQPDYVKHLIEMGEKDAMARLPEIREFLSKP